jgi:putative tricarboxylic transport membrane protein
MLKKYGDLISGGFLLILAIALFFGSFGVQRLTISRIGSGFVPQVVAVILAVVSIGVIRNGVIALKFHLNERKDKKEENKEQANMKGFALTLVLLLAYLFTLTTVGFLITTTVYLFAQMLILATKEQRKIPLLIGISVVTSVTVYFIFLKVFQLVLPAGILG